VAVITGGVIGVGYQGCDLDSFVRQLVAQGVKRLVDVRLTPLSRKPGFSKRALGAGLGQADIAYEHLPALGNPKANREGFAGTPGEVEAAKRRYQARLAMPEAARSLDRIAVAAREELVGVLCFEADESRCHREIVLRGVRERLAHAHRGGQ
jgi:uncharacterized protein (DUF488 family)